MYGDGSGKPRREQIGALPGGLSGQNQTQDPSAGSRWQATRAKVGAFTNQNENDDQVRIGARVLLVPKRVAHIYSTLPKARGAAKRSALGQMHFVFVVPSFALHSGVPTNMILLVGWKSGQRPCTSSGSAPKLARICPKKPLKGKDSAPKPSRFCRENDGTQRSALGIQPKQKPKRHNRKRRELGWRTQSAWAIRVTVATSL